VERNLLEAGLLADLGETRMIDTRRLGTLALILLVPAIVATTSAVRSDAPNEPEVICLAGGNDCVTQIIRIPDGQPGQVLKFEFCREGDCDRAHREHWRTQFLVPPPGEVCHNTDINEALHWLEQNARGWLLAGWGCVSKRQLPV
jgi:hypothetical protein